VWFWSNHFCISADKIQSMAGAYEREAIRPYVLGLFADMLQAVESHPAMLFYLDNAASMGPNSIAGINRTRGRNENLAREILELHTLGVRAGYTQDDVIHFANVLTGWTFLPAGTIPITAASSPSTGGCTSRGRRRSWTRSMRTPAPSKVASCCATSPPTPPRPRTWPPSWRASSSLTNRRASFWRSWPTRSATRAVISRRSRALVSSKEAWTEPRTKLKRPSEWVVSMVRATGVSQVDATRFTAGQSLLGEPLWRPPSPKGYADDEAAWIDGMGRRLDVANNFAERLANRVDPQFVMDAVLGSTISSEVRQAVARADSRPQALALLFMSPEFQRR